MQFIKNLPIERKVTLIMLLTCSAVLLASAAAIFGIQLVTFRQAFARDLQALGEIAAKNSTAALTFQDQNAAQEVLASLRAKPHIKSASLWLTGGELFAEYGLPLGARNASAVRRSGSWLEDGEMVYSHPIVLEAKPIGTLVLWADYRAEFHNLLKLYGTSLLLVLLLSILLALFLSAWLQGVISKPILSLAETAKIIADKKDYALRAAKVGQDELGLFTDAFNQMLSEIQSQDSALQTARTKLEEQVQALQREVKERERAEQATRESEQRFRQLAENINEVFWMTNLDKSSMLYVSPAYEHIWGRSCASLHENPASWLDPIHPDDKSRVAVAVGKQVEGNYNEIYRLVWPDGSIRWVQDRAFPVRNEAGEIYRMAGIAQDITEQKKAEQELDMLHKQLVDTSRQAGMAEVATGVLHNVGNVLNSVNVSATLVVDRLRRSKVAKLSKAAALLQEHLGDLPAYLSQDPKGRLLPDYLGQLSKHLEQENQEHLQELESLTKNVQHIKDIVAMQQSYARVSGIVEVLPVAALLEDALQINMAAFQRHGVEVVRQLEQVPRVAVDKHKVLQILVNLLRNAKHAMIESGRSDKRLVLGIQQNGQARVQIRIEDNGVGIAPENLTRIFSHGFTTKKHGHGFGLHSGALTAKEMGGALTAHSEGVGRGATFVLELPIDKTGA